MKMTRIYFALKHPKGYLHTYQDTGRVAIFISDRAARKKKGEYHDKYEVIEVEVKFI